MTYELGSNCAGETAAQVANYLLADLRVYLKHVGVPDTMAAPNIIVDRLSDGIVAALREASHAAQGGKIKP